MGLPLGFVPINIADIGVAYRNALSRIGFLGGISPRNRLEIRVVVIGGRAFGFQYHLAARGNVDMVAFLVAGTDVNLQPVAARCGHDKHTIFRDRKIVGGT